VLRAEGVVNIALNPGSLHTHTWDNCPRRFYWPSHPLLYKSVYGAYTNLWAAFDGSITIAGGGRCAIPWGQWHPGQRSAMVMALKSKEEEGTGQARELWDWCEEVTGPFVSTNGYKLVL
jgi:hypothetical protein